VAFHLRPPLGPPLAGHAAEPVSNTHIKRKPHPSCTEPVEIPLPGRIGPPGQ